jgi:quercetin dioxygenase-like cupin family protein
MAERVEAAGAVVTILLSESDVGIVEYQFKPGPQLGTPHHHTRESWSAYVLEGSARLRLDHAARELQRGDAVHMPAGRNFHWEEAAEGTRVLFVYTPGGFERYFVEIGKLFSSGKPLPELLPRIVALSESYGIERQS